MLYIILIERFNGNKLLVGNQYGVRKGIGTVDAIFKLTNEILTALNNTMVGGVSCNFEKASDSVNHCLLLSKLPYYGVSGKANVLLESYLQNRYQKVKISNSYPNSNSLKTCLVCFLLVLNYILLLYNPKKFKLILKKFLCENYFDSLDEYFEQKKFVTRSN
jgi:hypothetical protein